MARKFATLLTTAFICAIVVGNPMICKAVEYSETQAYTETETSDKAETAQAEVDTETVVGTESLEKNESIASGDTLNTGETLATDATTDGSNDELKKISDILTFIAGVMIFYVVVILCKYSYKFFNIFF